MPGAILSPPPSGRILYQTSFSLEAALGRGLPTLQVRRAEPVQALLYLGTNTKLSHHRVCLMKQHYVYILMYTLTYFSLFTYIFLSTHLQVFFLITARWHFTGDDRGPSGFALHCAVQQAFCGHFFFCVFLFEQVQNCYHNVTPSKINIFLHLLTWLLLQTAKTMTKIMYGYSYSWESSNSSF